MRLQYNRIQTVVADNQNTPMPFDMNILGKQINKYRKKANFNQRELCKQLKKGHSYINEIEHGNNSLSIPALIDICTVLQCTPNDLLQPFISIPSLNTTRKMTDEDRERIEKLVAKRQQFEIPSKYTL